MPIPLIPKTKMDIEAIIADLRRDFAPRHHVHSGSDTPKIDFSQIVLPAHGYIRSGQSEFNTGIGFYLGANNGTPKFSIGDPANEHLTWDGSTLSMSGSLVAGELHIPDKDTTANSFHTNEVGDTWWGCTDTNFNMDNENSVAYILNTGSAKFKDVVLTTNVVLQDIQAGSEISIQNWQHDLVFSVTDADTVAWASGTITLMDGTTYAIDAGNTGNMAARTYVYLDIATSLTVLQTTTTAATAVGTGKILIASAVNSTNEAIFQVFGGRGGIKLTGGDIENLTITASQIAANTITANEIVANTITATEMNVGTLSAIAANLGTITAGSIDINSGIASISSAGVAIFKAISIGGSTVQYSLADEGMGTYGDGSDGALTTSGNVTLTSDKYYTNLTISTGHTFNPNGWRVFVNGTLTEEGTGKIARNGNNGTNGENGTHIVNGNGGAGGTALAAGYLKGSPVGAVGGNGAIYTVHATTGGAGTGTSNSIGKNGSSNTGGTGGLGSAKTASCGGTYYPDYNPSSGGAGGTATASNVKLIANWHLQTLLDIGSTGACVKYDNSANGGGGGGGGSGSSAAGIPCNSPGNGGGGGGSGSGGGIIAIYAKKIIIGASASIQVSGGNGGNGGNGGASNGESGNGGGGCGGAGANGGQIILVYNELTNNGSITVTPGTGGSAGTGGSNGVAVDGGDGDAGVNGIVGTIRYFKLSL